MVFPLNRYRNSIFDGHFPASRVDDTGGYSRQWQAMFRGSDALYKDDMTLKGETTQNSDCD